jgi:hypothetical protein
MRLTRHRDASIHQRFIATPDSASRCISGPTHPLAIVIAGGARAFAANAYLSLSRARARTRGTDRLQGYPSRFDER